MEIQAVAHPIIYYPTDTLLVYLMVGGPGTHPSNATRAVDEALGGTLSEMIATGDFNGWLGQVTVLPTEGRLAAAQVVVSGLGKPQEFHPKIARYAVMIGVQVALAIGAHQLATVTLGTGHGGLTLPDSAQLIAEGALAGIYHYRARNPDDTRNYQPKRLDVLVYDPTELFEVQRGIEEGIHHVHAVMG